MEIAKTDTQKLQTQWGRATASKIAAVFYFFDSRDRSKISSSLFIFENATKFEFPIVFHEKYPFPSFVQDWLIIRGEFRRKIKNQQIASS